MKKSAHWKLLADLNLSHKTVRFLQELGVDIKRVEKSVNTDEGVVAEAEQESRAILTFDKDFGEIYYFHKHQSLTVIVLSLENQTAESVNKVLQKFVKEVHFLDVQTKLLIVYEGRYRIIG